MFGERENKGLIRRLINKFGWRRRDFHIDSETGEVYHDEGSGIGMVKADEFDGCGNAPSCH